MSDATRDTALQNIGIQLGRIANLVQFPLTVPYGGTGDTSLASHAVLLGEGISAVSWASVGTPARLLMDQGASADPMFVALTGCVTVSSSGVTTLLTIPSGTTAQGNIFWTNITAPGTPASGSTYAWADSTNKVLKSRNDIGTIANMAIPIAATANFFLTAFSSAGSFSSAQPSAGSISDFTGPTSWTPSDQSGAGLTFSTVAASYLRLGKLWIAWASLTYPSNSSSSVASIGGLPSTVTNTMVNGSNITPLFNNGGNTWYVYAVSNSTRVVIVSNLGGGSLTNSQASGAAIRFQTIYSTD